MTVSSAVRKAGPYTGTGLVSTYSFAFKVYTKNDIEVIRADLNALETTLVLDSDYVVSLNVDQEVSPGGSITLKIGGVTTTALTSGYKLTILGNLIDQQLTDITNLGGFFPQNIEDMADRAVMLIQQLEEKVDRAFLIPATSSASAGDLASEIEAVTLLAENFLGLYYGAYTSNPNVDPLGNPPNSGDMYYNTTTHLLMFYDANLVTWTSQPGNAALSSNIFSGTGAQVNFVLSTAPSSVTNMIVFVGGVAQRPTTDYTVNGATLTFVAAPPNAANNVLAFVVNFVTIGTVSSLNITYPRNAAEIAGGVFPVNYSYPWYNALRYAVGDASTDVTANLQVIINALPYGQALFFPALPDNLYFRITGANGLTVPALSSTHFYGESGSNSRIHNTTAGGNVFTSLAVYGVTPSNNTRWENLCITATNGTYGLKLRANNVSTIRSCQFRGFNFSSTSACVAIEDSIILTIDNNRFNNSKNGIYSVGSVNSGWNAGCVSNNNFEALTGFAIFADYMNGISVTGNSIETCLLGGIRVSTGGAGINICGNYFEENLTTGTAGAVEFSDIYIGSNSYVHGVNIEGNYFNGNAGTPLATTDYIPIRIKYARGWKIAANVLNTGTNFVKFQVANNIVDMYFGVIGFHLENAGCSFDKSTAVTATYSALPYYHAFLEYNITIEGISRIAGLVNQQYLRQIELDTAKALWTQAVTGTGAVVTEGRGFYVESGATAASTASAFINGMGMSVGAGQIQVKHASTTEITGEYVVSSITAGTSTGISFLMLTTAAVVANPTTRSVGFKIIQDAIWGLTHDGATLNLVDLGTSLAAGLTTQLKFVKGDGQITWYVNGVRKAATSTNVASVTDTAGTLLAVSNGANAAQQRLGLYDCKYSVTQ